VAVPPSITGVPARVVVREDNRYSDTDPYDYFDISGISITDSDLTGNIEVEVSANIGTFSIAAGVVSVSGHLTSTITIAGTLPDVLNYLKTPSNWIYNPPENLTGTGAATITISARDLGNPTESPSTPATLLVDIDAINDAPVVTAPTSISVTAAKTTALTGISFSDVDAGTSTVTVTLAVPSGTLLATAGPGVTVSGSSSSRSLTGSVADINAFIAGSGVQYTSTGSGTVTLTATINDGGNTGTGGALTDTRSVSIISSYDEPDIEVENISLSGATGTDGTFRIGDTVTVSWDNTSDGDDNPAINAVTMNFSQFGGGASVAATATDDVWTATYTIVAGTIDSATASVEVTASNPDKSASQSTAANTLIDNVAPTVTDAQVDISGATGNGGEFISDDTITATWKDTGGDGNSDTISGVTFDFSAFGGGAAVAATNVAGTWTASYTLPAGSIVANNVNIAATVTDNAGNVTTTADTTNASVDTDVPEVVSVVVPVDATYTIGQVLPFTVIFDQIVEIDDTGGSPRLAINLNTGGTVFANYQGGTGTAELTFWFTVGAGMVDPDGIVIAGLQLGGGTISDVPGNPAILALNGVGATGGILIDSPQPGGGSGSPVKIKEIWGTVDDDRLQEVSVDARYFGLEGQDTVVYDGSRADFSIELLPSGNIRLSGDNFTHTLNSIERIEFDDGTLIFDLASSSAAAVYRLYSGAFGRAPDEPGLLYWLDVVSQGTDLELIARHFLTSQEFTERFGPQLSNSELVELFYGHVLGRAGEAEGLQFWTEYLEAGGDRSNMLLLFTQLPEFIGISESDVSPAVWVG
jgi:hypothetical protein